jgi:hypothetical protein
MDEGSGCKSVAASTLKVIADSTIDQSTKSDVRPEVVCLFEGDHRTRARVAVMMPGNAVESI